MKKNFQIFSQVFQVEKIKSRELEFILYRFEIISKSKKKSATYHNRCQFCLLSILIPLIISDYIPQRYVLGFMGFLAVANAYTMRNVLSLTITEMVVHHHSKNDKIIIDPYSCPGHLEIKNHTDTVHTIFLLTTNLTYLFVLYFRFLIISIT